LGYLNQIYSDNEEKLVKEELRLAFINVLELDEKIKEIEVKM